MGTDATNLKRFFKKHFNIPVRVETGRSKNPFIRVWIMPEPRQPGEGFNAPIRYAHQFPAELGNRFMRIIYKGHPSLEAQNWGGNIGSTSLAAQSEQWEELLAQYDAPAESK